MRYRLLFCLARAAGKNAGRFLLSLAPGGEVLYDIAVDTWEEYMHDARGDALRAELEAIAQASGDELRQAVGEAVDAAAADQPPEVREALGAYLTQLPAAVRRSLRRPSDPGGVTAPPGLALRRADDLLQFLPSRPPRFKPGERPLPGVDWELEELVGVGGFGEVWKARHPYLKSKPPVALKFCLDAQAVAALRNEAGILDRVMQHGRHAGIVPLLHTYLSADPPCLEYEFVEGGDLAGLIQEMHARGKVKPEIANRLLAKLAETVAFAHRAEPPIVHGDLKPANVLVRRTADGKVALRITDFGIGGLAAAQAARETRQPTRSRHELLTEAVRGAYTPLYAAPEQMHRRPGDHADPRDDVHALGVIWYQMLTGDLDMMSIPPDWREQLTERGVSEDIIRLVGACLAPKAEKRPATAGALVEQIDVANLPMLELVDDGPRVKPGKPRPAPGPPTPRPPAAERPTAKPGPKTTPAPAPAPHKPPTVRRPAAETTQRVAETVPVARSSRAWWAGGCAAAAIVGLVVLAIGGLVLRSWWVDSQSRLQQAKAAGDKEKVPALVADLAPKATATEPIKAPAPSPTFKDPPKSTKESASPIFAPPPKVPAVPEFKPPPPKVPAVPAVRRAGLAIAYMGTPKSFADQWGLRGATGLPQIVLVHAGGGGEKMGLQGNDIVLRVNGRDVLAVGQAEAAIKAIPLGDTAELTVIRQGKERTLSGPNVTEFSVKEEMTRLIALAADDPALQALVGYFYSMGTELPHSDTEAVKWFRKSAENGNAIGQMNLAYHYENGLGLPKLDDEALRWYRKAADQNNSMALNNLGYAYAVGRLGLPKDYAKAIDLYRKAADLGNGLAMSNVGWCYEAGQGVKKDEVEAVRWYKKSAARDDPMGQCNLGVMYSRGGGGLAMDINEAIRLYRVAAAQGNKNAQQNLRNLGQ